MMMMMTTTTTMMMMIVITIVLRMMIKMMKRFFGVCLGGLGVLWTPFGAVFGHFEAPPGAFQHEAKSRSHSTSPFFEDVSSEIAIFERGRLKTSSSNS